MPNKFLLICVMVVVVGPVLWLLFRTAQTSSLPKQDSASPETMVHQGGKLNYYLGDPERYRLYVRTSGSGTRWLAVTSPPGEMMTGADGTPIELNDVRAWFATYLNGQMVEHWRATPPFPEGATFLQERPLRKEDPVTPSQLVSGRKYVRVTHEASPGHRNRGHYSTTLENISQEKIRVSKFAGYAPGRNGTFTLHTVSGDYYSADEFRSWYAQKDDWILPGGKVSDPQNYGGPGSLWVYFCETESGEQFMAGEIVPPGIGG